MTIELEWTEPPARGATTGARGAAFDMVVENELKRNPGKWACVHRAVTASHTRPWKDRGCEAVTRRAADGTAHRYDVYVRWPEDGATPVRLAEQPRVTLRDKAAAVTAQTAAANGAVSRETPRPEVKATPGAPTPGEERVDPKIEMKRDPATRPRRMTHESEQAYQIRVNRWLRGVPLNGRRP